MDGKNNTFFRLICWAEFMPFLIWRKYLFVKFPHPSVHIQVFLCLFYWLWEEKNVATQQQQKINRPNMRSIRHTIAWYAEARQKTKSTVFFSYENYFWVEAKWFCTICVVYTLNSIDRVLWLAWVFFVLRLLQWIVIHIYYYNFTHIAMNHMRFITLQPQ